jgi:hypothetical protein
VLNTEGEMLFQAPFLAVQRAHIIWVIPEQGKSEESNS